MTGRSLSQDAQDPQSGAKSAATDPSASDPSAGIARWARPDSLAWLGLVVVCLLVAMRAMQPIANTDLGWHLALGRYIVESGGVPDAEPFTHTARGAPMVAHEWLSQAIYHGVVQSGGLLALRALHAALAVAIVLALFSLLRREGVSASAALLGVFLYVVIAQARFQVRPQMFDLVFLVGLYVGVFVWKPALRPRQLVGIAAAVALWANLHSGALLFAALVAVYLAVESLQQWFGFREPDCERDLGRGELSRLLALALAVGGAALATPHHLRIVPYVLESGRINRQMSMEWLPLLDFWGHPAKPPLAVEVYLLIAVAFVWTALGLLRRRETSAATVAVVAVATALAFYSQRFVVLAFAPLLFALPEMSRRAARAAPSALSRKFAAALAIAGVAACTPLVLWPSGPLDALVRRFSEEASFRTSMFPVGAVRFLSELDLEGKLFNPSKWGGYVLFQTYDRYPTFIDGRWVTLGERVVEDSQVIARRKPGAFRLLETYGVDLVLVHRGWLTPAMRERDTWIPLFENLNAGIYLLRDPRNADDLRRVADYYAELRIPFDPASGFDERAAFGANRAWAERMSVSQWHLDQSQAYGDNMGSAGRWVQGW